MHRRILCNRTVSRKAARFTFGESGSGYGSSDLHCSTKVGGYGVSSNRLSLRSPLGVSASEGILGPGIKYKAIDLISNAGAILHALRCRQRIRTTFPYPEGFLISLWGSVIGYKTCNLHPSKEMGGYNVSRDRLIILLSQARVSKAICTFDCITWQSTSSVT